MCNLDKHAVARVSPTNTYTIFDISFVLPGLALILVSTFLAYVYLPKYLQRAAAITLGVLMHVDVKLHVRFVIICVCFCGEP